MRKLYSGLLAGLLFSLSLSAQKVDWVHNIGPTSVNDFHPPVDVCNDEDGNMYVVGIYKRDISNGVDTIQIDNPGTTSVFFGKYTKDGEPVWLKKAGSNTYDDATSIGCVNGNIYIGAYFQGPSIDLLDTSITRSSNKHYLLKLDTDGNFIDSRSYSTLYGIDNFMEIDGKLAFTKANTLFYLNEDLSIDKSYQLKSTSYLTIHSLVNVNDTATIVSGSFGTNITYGDTTVTATYSGSGSPGFMAMLSVDGRLNWIKTFGRFQDPYGLQTSYYPGSSQFYVGFTFRSNVDLLGTTIPFETGYPSVIAAVSLDGELISTDTYFPSQTGGCFIDELEAYDSGVYVGGATVGTGFIYQGETRQRSVASTAFVSQLNENLTANWHFLGGPQQGSTNDVRGLSLYNGDLYGAIHCVTGVNIEMGCPITETNKGALVFKLQDDEPNGKPVISFTSGQLGKELYVHGKASDYDVFYWDFNHEVQKDTNQLSSSHIFDEYGMVDICMIASNGCGITELCYPIEYRDMVVKDIHYVLNTAGSSYFDDDNTSSQSVGQLFYSKSTSEYGEIAEGILHPYSISENNDTTSTAIQEDLFALEINVYPNPVMDHLTIKTKDNNELIEYDIELYSASGQKIYQGTLIEQTSINMSDLPSGTYFLRLITKQGFHKSYSIIKNK